MNVLEGRACVSLSPRLFSNKKPTTALRSRGDAFLSQATFLNAAEALEAAGEIRGSPQAGALLQAKGNDHRHLSRSDRTTCEEVAGWGTRHRRHPMATVSATLKGRRVSMLMPLIGLRSETAHVSVADGPGHREACHRGRSGINATLVSGSDESRSTVFNPRSNQTKPMMPCCRPSWQERSAREGERRSC